jgi:MSHA biogenesis protein MshP
MISILGNFSSRPQQSGISLITGIFLLLLMSLLAAAMASLVSTSHVNMAADIGGARAYQAARAGVEWGMYQLDPNGQSAGLPSCPPATTLTAFPGYSVAVSCPVSANYTEGSKSIRIFRVVAVATATGVKAPGIERRVEVTFEKCRDSTITTAPYDC